MRQHLATFTTFSAGIVTASIAGLAWSTLSAQSPSLLCVGQDRVVRAAAGTACAAGERPLVAGATAPATQQQPAKTDDAALRALQDRVRQLEIELGKVSQGAVVKAPFTVTDSSGKPILVVTDYASDVSRGIYLRNASGGLAFSASVPSQDQKGGLVKVYDGSGPNPTTYVALGAFGANPMNLGLLVREKDVQRMMFGKATTGRFQVLVNGATGKMLAGIGESEAGSGVVLIATPEGEIRGRMYLDSTTRGGTVNLQNSSGVGVINLGIAKSAGGYLAIGGPTGAAQVELGVTAGNDGIACVRKIKSGQTCVGPSLPGTLPGVAK